MTIVDSEFAKRYRAVALGKVRVRFTRNLRL